MFAFNDILQKIEQEITRLQFTYPPKSLYDPIEYILSLGGKRIRPALVLMACNLYKENVDTAVNPALGLEVFHNFTLLHDDLMDDADKRRNKPTVHKVWNANTAILSGDAMLIAAYQLIGETESESLKEILDLFTRTALEICGGQQYDMDFEQKPKVSVVEYMHMIELKTSVLLAGSVVIGAMLGGASDEDCRRLRRFAVELGLAFQLQDDLLDSYGDQRLGKAIGGDILEGKKTYLMITAMSHADEATREMLRTAYRDPALSDAEKIGKVKSIYDRLDVPRLTEQQIQLRFERALSILDTLSVAPSRTQRMRDYAMSLMDRKN